MKLLYSDDRVVVIVKPAGMLSTDEPEGAPDAIRAALGEKDACIYGVHRLDRVTGGVMVYARTRRAASELGQQIAGGSFRKEYLAVLCGIPENRRGVLHDWLYRDRRGHKSYIVPCGSEHAQEAILEYAVLAADDSASLVSVSLHTGRTHQIRCQFSARGMPVFGDVKYGASAAGGVALWSHCIEFTHPRSGEQMCFRAVPPAEEPWIRFDIGAAADSVFL